MERRFQAEFQKRLQDLCDDARLSPLALHGAVSRLDEFLRSFLQHLPTDEQRTNAQKVVQGLLSDLESKDLESISYWHDQERQALQKFMGQNPWDHKPFLDQLVSQVALEIGQPDGILVLDPTSFPKKGNASVGVQRQWCGRLGKVDNCQVGIYLAYVSREEHALVDFRLYLPEEWAKDKDRRAKAGVPKTIRFQTRHELALEMIAERSKSLPHQWVTGDEEFGRNGSFRMALRSQDERYLLWIPSNLSVRVWRDVGNACPSTASGLPVFQQVQEWGESRPDDVWQKICVGAGEKGPIEVECIWTLVHTKAKGIKDSQAETLLVVRERQGDGSWSYSYALSNVIGANWVSELARVYKARHRIEECFRRAKSEVGLGDYQVRTWCGWHHHQMLSILAAWFLVKETRREKNTDAVGDVSGGSVSVVGTIASVCEGGPSEASSALCKPSSEAKRRGKGVSLEAFEKTCATAT